MNYFKTQARRAIHIALILSISAPGVWADDPPIDIKPDKVIKATPNTPENTGPTSPDHVKPGEPPVRKSYLIPAVEIPIFIVTLNRLDLWIYGPQDYDVSMQTIRD